MNSADLQAFLTREAIEAQIVFLEETTPTVEAAAQAVGVAPVQIVKSVLFIVKEDGGVRPQLVVTNGLSRVDYRALAQYVGLSRRRVRMAQADEVLSLTGYEVGTVPPFGHVQRLPTVLDETVCAQEEVYAGGGAINALMRLRVAELERVLAADVVRVSAW